MGCLGDFVANNAKWGDSIETLDIQWCNAYPSLCLRPAFGMPSRWLQAGFGTAGRLMSWLLMVYVFLQKWVLGLVTFERFAMKMEKRCILGIGVGWEFSVPPKRVREVIVGRGGKRKSGEAGLILHKGGRGVYGSAWVCDMSGKKIMVREKYTVRGIQYKHLLISDLQDF